MLELAWYVCKAKIRSVSLGYDLGISLATYICLPSVLPTHGHHPS